MPTSADKYYIKSYLFYTIRLLKIGTTFDKIFIFYIIIGIDILEVICYNFNKYAEWDKTRFAEGILKED